MVERLQKGARLVTISTGTIFRAIVIGLALCFLFAIREIIVTFLVAALLAVLMEPFADALEKRKVPRSLAALIVYVIGLAILAVLLWVIVPPALSELGNFLSVFSPYVASATGNAWQLDSLFAHGVSDGIGQIVATIQGVGFSAAVPQILAIGGSAFGSVASAIVVFILAYYLVAEKHAMVSAISSFTPAEYHPFVMQMASKMRERLGGWLRGQLLLMFSIFIITYIALLILGVPYALILAIIAGFLEVIPYIGPLLSGVPAVILAFSLSPVHALIVVGMYLLIQTLEGQLLVPKIMQHTTGINPIISLLAVLIGWKVGGIPGAIFAIPVANAIAVFGEEIWKRKITNE